MPATIYDVDRHLERPCILSYVSEGRAKLSGVRAATIPDAFRLRTLAGERRTCRVIRRTDHHLGVEFIDPCTDASSSKGWQPSRNIERFAPALLAWGESEIPTPPLWGFRPVGAQRVSIRCTMENSDGWRSSGAIAYPEGMLLYHLEGFARLMLHSQLDGV
jgi:hypothetical protein